MANTLLRRANRATVAVAAEILGVHYDLLYSAVFHGALPSRADRTIDLEDAEAYLALRRVRRKHVAVELYRDGVPPAIIAERLGIKLRSVQRRLCEAGIRQDEVKGMACRAYRTELARAAPMNGDSGMWCNFQTNFCWQLLTPARLTFTSGAPRGRC